MKIESLDRDVQQVLSTGYYRIPRFQRPYSWTEENLEEFWTDTIVDSSTDYFIGAIIVFQTGKSRFDVVDGQQRLTTLTIMLSSLRDAFDRSSSSRQASGVHNFIERPNVDDEPEYVLQTETSYPFFHEWIQKHGSGADANHAASREELALQRARQFFDEKLRAIVGGIETDPRVSDANKPKKIHAAIASIRDQVLALKLILVTVDNEDDAYTIFETLNSRGINLTVADLVKNHLLKHLRKHNAGVDRPRDKWEHIHDLFDASSANLDVSRFIHHQWLSEHDYVPGSKLFRRIKKEVTKARAGAYLDDLVADSEIYRSIREPGWRAWGSGQREIAQSLRALAVFGVDQPIPFLMSVLRAMEEKTVRAPLARRAVRVIENYHFIFTAVTGTSSSGGITKMYARYAREVANATDANQVGLIVDELKGKLKVPSEEVFTASFMEIGYSAEASKQKNLVRYILEKHYDYHATGARPDFAQMTIEHLLPQSGNAALSASIGNLILVDEALNNRLSNKGFADKQKELANSGQVWVDPELLSAAHWDRASIELRTKKMAALAYQTIWG
ncbi:MAG: DUF262 domain-containing HNH endonuclease family protein [Ilumatobacteraceae bacterium]